MLWPEVRTGFRYNATIKYSAVHSTLAHEQIVAMLRGFVGSQQKAPIVTELEPLLDILVHTQDICIPLAIEHPMPVDAAVAAADRVLVLRGPIAHGNVQISQLSVDGHRRCIDACVLTRAF